MLCAAQAVVAHSQSFPFLLIVLELQKPAGKRESEKLKNERKYLFQFATKQAKFDCKVLFNLTVNFSNYCLY